MKIKVMVISDDKKLCGQIRNEAHFTSNKMDVLAWEKPDEKIIDCFYDINPRLLILDADAAPAEALITFVRKINEVKPKCHILVIGGTDNPSLMQTLLRTKISTQISKPLDLNELNRELTEISETIRRITPDAIDYDTAVSMQSLYFWKIIFEEHDLATDIPFINRTLESSFKEGFFRVVMFRLDEATDEIPDFNNVEYYDDLHEIQRYIKRTVSNYIYEYCHEMIFDFRFNGVLGLFNYDPANDEIVLNKFAEMSDSLYRYACLNFAMTVTICIGGAYPDLANAQKSREEAYSAVWTRMKDGSGKVLYYRKKYDSSQLYEEQLKDIVNDFNLSAETLNVEDFHRAVDKLFSLPEYVLLDYKSRSYILDFVDTFFETNANVLSHFVRLEPKKEEIKKTLNFSNTLEAYKKNFVQQFDELFELLADETEKKNLRILRKAARYIKDNYDKPITAEILADVVHLSPIYFSYLFKKSVGMNMTDYITEYRMKIAKELLFETDKSIYEIALAVGFQDQRYFSKRFKHIVGMTPSEYRKMK